jgi:hypothetical protein
MRIPRGVVASGLALAVVTLSISPAQAKTSVPRPLAGHWKIEKGLPEVSSGSLIVSKSRTTVRHLSFTPETPFCSSTTPIHVVGNFHLYNVADDKHGASDNTPDWAITKRVRAMRKVTAHQGKTVLHGKLSLGFGSKNGTRKPVKFVSGEFVAPGCAVLLGGTHG